VRRQLRKAIRRSPRTAFRDPKFLRRAAFADFKLPITIRLREETQLGITMLSNRRPLDSLAFPEPAAEQLLDLAGHFGAEIQFNDSGFGIVGSMQARTGNKLAISTLSPLRFADFGDCGPTPPDPLPRFVESTPNEAITMSPGPLTWTLLNPFSGAADGNLYVNLSVRSRVRRSSATCAAPGDAADYTVPATLPTNAPVGYVPVRLDWNGKFRIAPAITADGAIRFGKIDGDSAVSPQPLTTGNIWACAPTAVLSGPTVPSPAPCTEQSAPLDPVMEDVGAAPFAAQFRFERFTADVLLGDIALPPPTP
jgi:hypothetical protein